jgi:hypothetical protein
MRREIQNPQMLKTDHQTNLPAKHFNNNKKNNNTKNNNKVKSKPLELRSQVKNKRLDVGVVLIQFNKCFRRNNCMSNSTKPNRFRSSQK